MALSPFRRALLNTVLEDYASLPAEDCISISISSEFEQRSKRLLSQAGCLHRTGIGSGLRRLAVIAALVALLTFGILSDTPSRPLQNWKNGTFSFLYFEDARLPYSSQGSETPLLAECDPFAEARSALSRYTAASLVPNVSAGEVSRVRTEFYSLLTDTNVLITFVYHDTPVTLNILFLQNESIIGGRSYEMDKATGQELVAGGITHILGKNLAQTCAVWINGGAECSLISTLSMQETETLLRSIYGE